MDEGDEEVAREREEQKEEEMEHVMSANKLKVVLTNNLRAGNSDKYIYR